MEKIKNYRDLKIWHFARQYNKEYIQFLYVAFGSCVELETQLEIAKRLQFGSREKIDNLLNEIPHLLRMIMALIKVVSN